MISILILTKNSEETLEASIDSVKDLEGEILVIDAGSEDKTLEIAKKGGARVIEKKFRNFSEQRNIAASYAKYEWLLYIDSDEVATNDFKKELLEAIGGAGDDISGFFIYRKTFFLGKDWGLIDKVQRVFKKDRLVEWKGVVHETPVVKGEMGEIKSPLLHYTHRKIEQMVDKTNEWSEYEAELRLKSGHPKMTSWRFARVMLTGFLKSYLKEGGWRNGTAGVVEALFQSFSMFITYAKLWEKQD